MKPLVSKINSPIPIVTIIIVSLILFTIYFISGFKNGTENCFTIDNKSNDNVKIILTTKSSLTNFDSDTVTKIIYPGQTKCIYHEETLFGDLKNDGIKDLQRHFRSVQILCRDGSLKNLFDQRFWIYRNGSNENQYTLTVDDLFADN